MRSLRHVIPSSEECAGQRMFGRRRRTYECCHAALSRSTSRRRRRKTTSGLTLGLRRELQQQKDDNQQCEHRLESHRDKRRREGSAAEREYATYCELSTDLITLPSQASFIHLVGGRSCCGKRRLRESFNDVGKLVFTADCQHSIRDLSFGQRSFFK